MYEQEYAKVTVTVETSTEVFTYEMPKVAGVDYHAELSDPEIYLIQRPILDSSQRPRRLSFAFKAEEVDGHYMTVKTKKTGARNEDTSN